MKKLVVMAGTLAILILFIWELSTGHVRRMVIVRWNVHKLSSTQYDVRSSGIESLGALRAARAVSRIVQVAKSDQRVLSVAASAIARIGGVALQDLLSAYERENDPAFRRWLVLLLGRVGIGCTDRQRFRIETLILKEIERNPSMALVSAAVPTLGTVGSERSLPFLVSKVAPRSELTVEAARSLLRIGDHGRKVFREILESEQVEIRRAMVEALSKLEPETFATRLLFSRIEDPDIVVRVTVLRGLGRGPIQGVIATEEILSATRSRFELVRAFAVRSLRYFDLSKVEIESALRNADSDPSTYVRKASVELRDWIRSAEASRTTTSTTRT